MNHRAFHSLGVALALTLGACGPGEDGDATGGTGGGGASGSQSSAGGAGGAPQETGGASSGGTGGGATSTGGAGPSGGTSSGGGPGAGTGGATGSGGAPGGDCTRELLDGLLDDYFAALAAGDPSSLPLAGGVKFTENAVQAAIGTTDFWRNAGEVKHSQRALDTEACSAAAQAVIPEGGRDLPVALRIKVEGSEMTEIETIVVRPGDYTASFAVASDPAAIIAIADDIGWHDEVPEAERATRQELTSWIDKYFRAFPSGVCNVTGACKRLENGGGNFSCRAGASCSAGAPGSGGTFIPRVILADEVRGIAVGLTMFDFMTDGHLDMHMIKMSGGEVHAVHAILRDTNGVSGWE
ncbi:hypothetical protein WMF20_05515 [Sorangium sp. So ce834]|uniref:hypothetical protein n=1 Tax=Sorangium sp. So ce834 TaxID=3133321 RepID=UPI003F60BCB4